MREIKWREVFKFLSGAAFAGTLANAFLWYERAYFTFLGVTLSPRLFGVRAGVGAVLTVTLFYFAWIREQKDLVPSA